MCVLNSCHKDSKEAEVPSVRIIDDKKARNIGNVSYFSARFMINVHFVTYGIVVAEILMKSAGLNGEKVRENLLQFKTGDFNVEILKSLAKSFPSRDEV